MRMMLAVLAVIGCATRAAPPEGATPGPRGQAVLFPAVAPDSTPTWFFADTNFASNGVMKRVLKVRFELDATIAQKQVAVDSVGGVVVGGYRLTDDPEGIYYIHMPNVTSVSDLHERRLILNRQPGVRFALLVEFGGPSGRRPRDGSATQDTTWPGGPIEFEVPGDSTDLIWTMTRDGPLAYYRSIFRVKFFDSVSGGVVRQTLADLNATVIGISPARLREEVHGWYIIQVPDPGPTAAAVDSLIAVARAAAGVQSVFKAFPVTPTRLDSRLPIDGMPGLNRQASRLGSATDATQAFLIRRDTTGFPAVAPDSTPAWFQDDSSWTTSGMLKRVLGVAFQEGSDIAARKAAVDSISGVVVGGYRPRPEWMGWYYIWIDGGSTEEDLLALINKLQGQASVHSADLVVRGKTGWRRPVDGVGWRNPDDGDNWTFANWRLDPFSTTAGETWALSSIGAPNAWGCAVGAMCLRQAAEVRGYRAPLAWLILFAPG